MEKKKDFFLLRFYDSRLTGSSHYSFINNIYFNSPFGQIFRFSEMKYFSMGKMETNENKNENEK